MVHIKKVEKHNIESAIKAAFAHTTHIQHDSPIFTSFCQFIVFLQNVRKFFITIWLDRALITLSNGIVFI